MKSGERRHLQESYLELGADGGPAVLGAAPQCVLLVAALDAFKQVVDKVQADGRGCDKQSEERGMLGGGASNRPTLSWWTQLQA